MRATALSIFFISMAFGFSARAEETSFAQSWVDKGDEALSIFQQRMEKIAKEKEKDDSQIESVKKTLEELFQSEGQQESSCTTIKSSDTVEKATSAAEKCAKEAHQASCAESNKDFTQANNHAREHIVKGMVAAKQGQDLRAQGLNSQGATKQAVENDLQLDDAKGANQQASGSYGDADSAFQSCEQNYKQAANVYAKLLEAQLHETPYQGCLVPGIKMEISQAKSSADAEANQCFDNAKVSGEVGKTLKDVQKSLNGYGQKAANAAMDTGKGALGGLAAMAPLAAMAMQSKPKSDSGNNNGSGNNSGSGTQTPTLSNAGICNPTGDPSSANCGTSIASATGTTPTDGQAESEDSAEVTGSNPVVASALKGDDSVLSSGKSGTATGDGTVGARDSTASTALAADSATKAGSDAIASSGDSSVSGGRALAGRTTSSSKSGSGYSDSGGAARRPASEGAEKNKDDQPQSFEYSNLSRSVNCDKSTLWKQTKSHQRICKAREKNDAIKRQISSFDKK